MRLDCFRAVVIVDLVVDGRIVVVSVLFCRLGVVVVVGFAWGACVLRTVVSPAHVYTHDTRRAFALLWCVDAVAAGRVRHGSGRFLGRRPGCPQGKADARVRNQEEPRAGGMNSNSVLLLFLLLIDNELIHYERMNE